MEETIRLNVNRCPFCHESVAFQTVAWVACAGCLARHHASCWEESRACACCGDGRSLALEDEKPQGRRPWARILLSLVGFLLCQVATGLLVADYLNAHDHWRERCYAVADTRISEVERSLMSQRSDTWEALRKLDQLSASVQDLKCNVIKPTVLVVDRADGKAEKARAIDVLDKLANARELTDFELTRARVGLEFGRVKPWSVEVLLRCAGLKKDGKLAWDEFEHLKTLLLAE